MKNLLFLGFITILAFTGKSQVVVVSNDIIGIGDTAIIATDTNAVARELQSASDTSLVWDFTDLQVDTLDTIFYTDPSGTPYASDFPSANMYQYQENTGSVTDVNTYIIKDTTGLTKLGIEGDLLSSGTIHKMEYMPNGQKQFFMPLQYTNGTDTMGDYSETYIMYSGDEIGQSSIDSIKIKQRAWQRVKVDAFGIVKLPNAEYDCVRESRATHNIDSVWVLIYGNWNLVQNTDTIIYQYSWFTDVDSVNYPVVQVKYDSVTNKSDTIFKFFYVKKGTDTTQQLTVHILGNKIVCQGDSVILSAKVKGGSGNYDFLWNDSNTDSVRTVIIDSTTTYILKVTDHLDTTCFVQDTITITVEKPSVSITSSLTAVCLGQDVILSSTGADTYNWIEGTTGSSATVTVSPSSEDTTYTVVGTSNGCSDTASITITVYPDSVPNATFLVDSSKMPTISFTANESNAQAYIWNLGDSTIDTGQAILHTYEENGVYAVMLTVENSYGCKNSSTINMHITHVDIELVENDDFRIYPNPTTGLLYITKLKKGDKIEVYSITGAELIEKEASKTVTTLNLSAYNSGVYFVKIHTGNKIVVRKLILK